MTESLKESGRKKSTPRIMVLRWGHRPHRDARLTTHVALVSRALGATGMMLSDVVDVNVKRSVDKVNQQWGGRFSFEMGKPWRQTVYEWKADGGVIVHLTAYGENVEGSDVLNRIKASGRDVLVIVGSQKVPHAFFSEEVSDFNVAVGNQPHSECASLAVFLDRFFGGKELTWNFEDAALWIVPQRRGKKTTGSKPSNV